MSISKAVISGVGAVAALTILSTQVSAGTPEALAACKDSIQGDARLSSYSKVFTDTDSIQRRSRYTTFEINVRAEEADGGQASWDAVCKATGSGKVKELELVQTEGAGAGSVAQTGG